MRLLRLSIIVAAFLLPSLRAHADVITYSITFSINPDAAAPAPFNGNISASGSYAITFDPSQTYSGATAGLVVNSFHDSISSVAIPAAFNYTAGQDFFEIGGIVNGVNQTAVNTDDYYLSIANWKTTPTIVLIADSTKVAGQYYSNVGSYTLTVAPTPEAPTIVFTLTGVLFVALLAKSRCA